MCLDKATDVAETAQMLIFILGVNKDCKITDELLSMESRKDITVGGYMFQERYNCWCIYLDICFDRQKLDWRKPVSITTDEAPALTSKNILIGK